MSGNDKINDNCTIGIISDTHGLLRPQVVSSLKGADLIIHAGDVGDPSILDKLDNITSVVAVRGNMDAGSWAFKLSRTELVARNKMFIYVLHDISKLDLDPAVSDIKVVISGHTHRPSIAEHEGILYVNPGSAGPRRFNLPVSVALLHIKGDSFKVRLMKLRV
jgi:putative phosphoesterase